MRCEPPVDLRPFFVTLDDLTDRLNWVEFFGNWNRVELDIGCGRGLFLFNASLTHPDTNYLGIELDYKEGRRAARRLKKRDLTNARVLGGDIRVVLAKWIPPHSISAVHVYFPDPWWKRKHKKRRLFTDAFADRIADVLEPSGLLHCWTDVKDYFDTITALMDHHPQFEALVPPDERDPAHDMDYQTSFERKKRQEGLIIHRGLWRRRPIEKVSDTRSVPPDD